MTRRDPFAAERAEHSFMNTLMNGHAAAAWAMCELKMLLLVRRKGGNTKHEIDERMQRMSRLLRKAAVHVDTARGRLP